MITHLLSTSLCPTRSAILFNVFLIAVFGISGNLTGAVRNVKLMHACRCRAGRIAKIQGQKDNSLFLENLNQTGLSEITPLDGCFEIFQISCRYHSNWAGGRVGLTGRTPIHTPVGTANCLQRHSRRLHLVPRHIPAGIGICTWRQTVSDCMPVRRRERVDRHSGIAYTPSQLAYTQHFVT